MGMTSPETKNRVIKILYLVTFLSSVHYAFVLYINSSYLENFIVKEKIGLLYALASVFTIIVIPNLSRVLKMYGQFKTVLSVLSVDLAAIVCLAIVSSPLFPKTTLFPVSDGKVLVENITKLSPWIGGIVVTSFLAFQISITMNRILLDVYMEKFSKENETGNNRGWFLTAMNVAIALSPFIVGKILTNTNDGFWKVYMISAIFLTLSLILVASKLKSIKDVNYNSPPFLQTIKKMVRDKNIFNIYLSSLLLEFFYSWMVIYTPIYLYNQIGLSWNQIGTIFSIMLTAFVIFELPLGKIADKYLGEKEILTAGFIIIGISTALLTFIESKSLVVWALALFITRVGASAIEIMNETYFFKKVKATDADIIGFFRNASPMAYIIGPGLASIILYFIDYKYLFLILGVIMLSGIKFSLSIKDTL